MRRRDFTSLMLQAARAEYPEHQTQSIITTAQSIIRSYRGPRALSPEVNTEARMIYHLQESIIRDRIREAKYRATHLA